VPGSLNKKAEEDATFYLINKNGTFFPLFCLTNPALETRKNIIIGEKQLGKEEGKRVEELERKQRREIK
jgi:hypothetical protein